MKTINVQQRYNSFMKKYRAMSSDDALREIETIQRLIEECNIDNKDKMKTLLNVVKQVHFKK